MSNSIFSDPPVPETIATSFKYLLSLLAFSMTLEETSFIGGHAFQGSNQARYFGVRRALLQRRTSTRSSCGPIDACNLGLPEKASRYSVTVDALYHLGKEPDERLP